MSSPCLVHPLVLSTWYISRPVFLNGALRLCPGGVFEQFDRIPFREELRVLLGCLSHDSSMRGAERPFVRHLADVRNERRCVDRFHICFGVNAACGTRKRAGRLYRLVQCQHAASEASKAQALTVGYALARLRIPGERNLGQLLCGALPTDATGD